MTTLFRRWIGTVLLCAAASTGAAQAAEDSLARVEAYLGALKTLSAEFAQVVRNRDGDIVERALNIAADICIYTNRNLTIEVL